MNALAEHARKSQALAAELARIRSRGASAALDKSTSNLFRRRDRASIGKLDVRNLDRVLSVDQQRITADVEGMATYETLADETLRLGFVPAVVPQLKTITVGGAVAGLGIESSSFRFGLAHETVEEMEILLGDGSIVTCSKTQEPELFFGFPNSYGTLGYVLRLKIGLIPSKRYVRLTHAGFSDARRYFAHIADICGAANVDYIDGTIFGCSEMYATTGEFTDEAPYDSDYTYLRVYYKSIRERATDYLTASNYIWRWDTDWFWCSKQFHAQNPIIRLLATKWALNSRTYQRIMRIGQRLLPDSDKSESVIQDVDIPIDNAPEFFDFLMNEIRILPVWVCPFKRYAPAVTYDLYALQPDTVYINFGFWDVIPTTKKDAYHNRRIESKMLELGGKKGLYSTSYFDRETFWKLFNGERYRALKQKYDPGRAFPDLYEKCVERR